MHASRMSDFLPLAVLYSIQQSTIRGIFFDTLRTIFGLRQQLIPPWLTSRRFPVMFRVWVLFGDHRSCCRPKSDVYPHTFRLVTVEHETPIVLFFFRFRGGICSGSQNDSSGVFCPGIVISNSPSGPSAVRRHSQERSAAVLRLNNPKPADKPLIPNKETYM